ncbi:MAG: phage tail protein [Geobacter sp.]|nr:phage tail protein [Geobacter sp.]
MLHRRIVMDCYLGMVTTFAFSFAPMGFAQCNGQQMNITQNSALYSLLGIAFGGDSKTYFNVPDLRSRVPAHCGQGNGLNSRTFAVAFGQENETLATANLPPHNHPLAETQTGQTVTATATATVNATTALGTLPGPTGNYWSKVSNGSAGIPGYNTPKNTTMASDAVTVAVTPVFNKANLTIGATGSGTAFPLAQPSLALNFCICTAGIYPTRT